MPSPPSKAPPPTSALDQWRLGDRLALAAAFKVAAERGLQPDGSRLAKVVGPQTDEELLVAVEELSGYRIPRKAVCVEHGHSSPAEVFCDLYFERLTNVLWIGNRGGGKTTNSGFLHGAKAYWHDNYKTAIAASVEKQSYRAYAELKRFMRSVGDSVLDTLMSKTFWTNGSENEVLGGTVKQLNGPHPHFAQLDEAELILDEPFQEFLNMAQGDVHYAAQQLLTSTRKKAYGMVQKIVNECDEARKKGLPAPWEVRIFCIFETLAPVTNCRSAPENAGRPESELCDCNTVVKGEWDDDAPSPDLKGQPRSFDTVCGGRAFRADGFVKLVDAQTRFKQLSRATWEAQQECLRASIEGIVHKWYDERRVLMFWQPHPMFGPVYRGWDWGGENPHAIVWCQYLNQDVGLVFDEDGDLVPLTNDADDREIVRTLKAGTLVQFDEIYGPASDLGEFSTLGMRAVLRQLQWWSYGFTFDIEQDYCDPAGLVGKREARKAVRQLREALRTGQLNEEQAELLSHFGLDPEWIDPEWIADLSFQSRSAPRYESIRKHIEKGTEGKVVVVEPMCPHTSDEYGVYHWEDPKPGKNLPEDAAKEDDHAMDAKRYLIWGVEGKLGRAPTEAPAAVEKPKRQADPKGMFQPPRQHPSESAVPTVSVDEGLPDYLVAGPGMLDTPEHNLRSLAVRRHAR